MRTLLIATVILLCVSSGYAQEPVTTATQAATAPTATATQVEETEVLPPTAPKALDDGLTVVNDRLTDTESRLSKLESAMKKLSIGGYIQARYEAHQDAFEGVRNGSAGEPDSFYIRRGRVKFTFKATDWSRFVLYPDLSASGVSLKDAYVDLREQWTGTQVLRVGQFQIPYGYEIEYSSSKREVPERTRWERSVFSGERDRGAALYGDVAWVNYAIAVLNGNGIKDSDGRFEGFDNNFEKQYVGRVGIKTKHLSTGISGSHNTKLIPAVSATESIPGHDNTEYVERAAGVYAVYQRDIAPVGEFQLKGEYNRGWTAVFADRFGKTKAGFLQEERRTKMLGWHVLVSQFIGDHNQLAYRIEQFDADLESRDRACNTGEHFETEGCHLSRLTVHTMAWNLFLFDNVRITTALEIPRHAAWKDREDMTFTEQVQYKF